MRGKTMFNKILSISILGLIISVMTTTESHAVFIGGSWVSFTGSISCEQINLKGVGNIQNDPKSLSCLADALDQQGIPVLVFCSNNGGNTASGVQASLGVIFDGSTTIFPTQV